ncbi:MAG: hypothetical protein R2739_10175 [Chitinophagales bacterium]|nr:hypothetical protein [Bacteroidota bacterium]
MKKYYFIIPIILIVFACTKYGLTPEQRKDGCIDCIVQTESTVIATQQKEVTQMDYATWNSLTNRTDWCKYIGTINNSQIVVDTGVAKKILKFTLICN